MLTLLLDCDWFLESYWFCSQLCAKKCHIIFGSVLLQSAVGISVSCTHLIAVLLFYFTCHLNLRWYTCYYPLFFFFFVNEYNTHLVLITFSRNDRMSEILMNFPFSIPQFSHCLICIADSFWMLNHIPLKFPPSHSYTKSELLIFLIEWY